MRGSRLRDTEDHITQAAVDGSAAKLVPSHSIALVVRSGILNRTLPIALVPFEAAFNQDLRVLTPASVLNAEWLTWALIGASEDIRRACRKDGVTVASIDAKRLAEYRLPVPPRNEQDRLVEVLDRLLGGVRAGHGALERAFGGLATFRRAVLHEAMSAEQAAALGEIADIASGITKGRRTKEPKSPHPFLRAANLRDGWLDLTEVKDIDVTEREMLRLRLQEGDVLMVEGSGSPARLGQGWIWEGQVAGCLHQNHVFRARPDVGLMLPRYLAWALQAPAAKAYFFSIAKTTSGLATINKRQVSGLPVPLPSLAEQARTVERVEHLLAASASQTQALQGNLTASAQLRESVLQAALTGDLSPGTATTKSPSELLGRIATGRLAAAPVPGRRAGAGREPGGSS